MSGDARVMRPRFPRQGAGRSGPHNGSLPHQPDLITPDYREDRACCCPAQPVVRAIMPPVPQRPHPVDLLLCGHHYRVCRQALIAAGALIYDMQGKEEAEAAALLDVVRAPAGVG